MMLVRVGMAAAVAVAVVLIAVGVGDRGPSAFAQSGGVGGTASCGSGNPLDGRTQGVVDEIVVRLKAAGTLMASETCSDVTNADLAGLTGTFNFANHGLTQLRAQDFAGLSSVRTMFLRFNHLTSLPANTFSGLSSVTRLWVDENSLTSVEAGAFNGLDSLQSLYLGENELSMLPATVFSGSSLNALRVVVLSGNRFASLPSMIFQRLPALTTINVSDNFLTSDQLGFLSTSIPTLTTVYLNENLLTSDGTTGLDPDLPTDIFGIHALHSVHLDDNRIVELPTGVFSGMTNVRTIRVMQNRIAKLQTGVLQGVTWSSSSWPGGSVWFEGNLIRTVEEGVFNRGPCEPPATPGPSDPTNCILHIYLNYNLIESVPAGLFSGMTRLRTVRLDGNKLTTVPATLYSGLSSLDRVYLQQNLISSLPDGLWSGLSSLDRVELNDNQLTSVSTGWFNGLPPITFGVHVGKPSLPRVLNLWDNSLPQSALAPLQAALPHTQVYFEDQFSATPRVIPEDDGTREEQAYCGAGHTLTGRTIDIVWRIMRGAFPRPTAWPAAVASNPSPTLQTSWPFSLSSWQSRHGPAGMRTATTIYPALCNLMTADDLARIRSLSSAGSKKNLNANDFAGLTNLRSLTLASSWGTTQIREFPAGLFDGLTNLRNLEMRNGLLGTLPAGIFDDLTSLQTLNLRNNLLTSLPDGIFRNTGNLRLLNLGTNRLNSLPSDAFSGLGEMRVLYLELNDLDAEDLPVGIFNGMSKLRTLSLWGNNFNTLFLDVFANQGLSNLRSLRIGLPIPDRATPEEFAAYRQSLPFLTRLDRLTGAQISDATPTPVPPTPTPTSTPTFHERIQLPIVSKVVPLVRSFTVKAGDEIRLSFALYNVQDALDNDLFSHDSMRIVWSDSGAGTFSESRGSGSDRDGEIDDREVIWRAPNLPGRQTVRASITPDWACNGSATECVAVFTVNVVRAASTATPEPTPCPTAGTVPATVDGKDGNSYSVITPAEGGEFMGDSVSVTVPRGALSGCGYVGLRAYAVLDAGASAGTRYGNWTVGGMRYAVDAASADGTKLANMVVGRPADVCVPLPDEFRATLSGLTLLRELGGGVQELTTKVRRDATQGFRLCGAVSEFPAVVVAASRGEFGVIVAPSPTPEVEAPETGGGAPTILYVMLAFLLGVLVLTGIGRIWRTE